MRPILVLSLLLVSAIAQADPRVFVTLQDDGTIENHALKTQSDLNTIHKKLLALYKATGEPIPEILSVWTTFSLGGTDVSTIFDPFSNDVTGIGLQTAYPPQGVFKSSTPPLHSILFHNNVLALASRASLQNAPLDGFANYLFLLELSHNWGPAIQVPIAPLPAGQTPTTAELIGFSFHWSFWMDAGGSPAGGNVWTDNGDGTFTVTAADPKNMRYSMLDLYLMGLAKPAEVLPFGVLENAVPPPKVGDPLWGGPYAARSFPWFDSSTPFTVHATRRSLTIDDVVQANGARAPDADNAPKSWQLGIVLLVSQNDAPDAIAAAQQLFDPLASACAPAFHAATQARGTLEVVTYDPAPATDADAATSDADAPDAAAAEVLAAADAGTDAEAAAAAPTAKSGCTAARAAGDPLAFGLLLVAVGVRIGQRRARTRPATARSCEHPAS